MGQKELQNLLGVDRAFLGLQSPLDRAKVAVLPVPYDSTTSYGVGTRLGPNAIIDASAQVELYDIESGRETCESLPVHTLNELALDRGDPAVTCDLVKQAVGHLVKMGKKPVVLGGEHSITAGAVGGFEAKGMSVLQIDAHTDLRDSYEGTKYNHACAMRRVRDLGAETVHVGVRSMCAEEAGYIREEGLSKDIFYAEHVRGRMGEKAGEIVSRLKGRVYVSVDVDGFDPSVFPGTGTPEPGGLLWDDVISLMRLVGERKEVVGFDIVEVLPVPPLKTSEFAAARLAYKMMGYFWGR